MAKKDDKNKAYQENLRFRQSLIERSVVSPEKFGMANWGRPPAPTAPKAEWDKYNAEMKMRAPMVANPDDANRMARQRADLVTTLGKDYNAPKKNALKKMLGKLKGGKGGRLGGISGGGGVMPYDVR